VIEIHHGSGAFVSDNLRTGKHAEALRGAQTLVANTIERLRARALTADEIRRLFEAELAGLSRTGRHRG